MHSEIAPYLRLVTILWRDIIRSTLLWRTESQTDWSIDYNSTSWDTDKRCACHGLQSGLHLAMFFPRGEESARLRRACAHPPSFFIPGTLKFLACIAISSLSRPLGPSFLALSSSGQIGQLVFAPMPGVAKGQLFSKKVDWTQTWDTSPYLCLEAPHIGQELGMRWEGAMGWGPEVNLPHTSTCSRGKSEESENLNLNLAFWVVIMCFCQSGIG